MLGKFWVVEPLESLASADPCQSKVDGSMLIYTLLELPFLDLMIKEILRLCTSHQAEWQINWSGGLIQLEDLEKLDEQRWGAIAHIYAQQHKQKQFFGTKLL
ncbi:hypothetical protein GOP47_0020208 [Adiantum capillus-veneris]|uniref:Uncharacterized protein n=1 Tax=Adiantum capillus-veneris TaxID=13818 RepID=A0A9D4Z7T4_ADICA|nr:hypothetical protein GOP47_0020208 [Adiantum capillus-veneris]